MKQASTIVPASAGRKAITLDGILALGAAVVLALSMLYTPEAPPGITVCTFYSVTGLPCPGCGLTRSFCAISHGRPIDAWSFNPFGFFWYVLTAFFLVRPLLTRRGGYVARERKFLASHWGYIVPIVLVLAMWSFGLCRMWLVARERTPPAVTSSPQAEPSSSPNPSASPEPARDAEAGPSTDSPA